eukprot:366519-Chlamydomonas_euryale.AAC.11
MILRATALQQQGRLNAAEAELTSCLERWPTCARAHAERGRLRADAGNAAAALSDFKAALQAQPDLLMALIGCVRAHLALGRPGDAARDYARAIQIDPDSGQLRALKEEIRNARAAEGGGQKGGGGALGVCIDVRARLTMDLPYGTVSMPSSSASHVGADDDPFAGLDTPHTTTRRGAKVCMVCMDKERGCRLQPCLHAALCVECANGLMARRFGCPICSTRIGSVEPGSFDKTYTADEAAALAAIAVPLRSAAVVPLPQLLEDDEALANSRSLDRSDWPPAAGLIRTAATPAADAGGIAHTPRSHTDEGAAAQRTSQPPGSQSALRASAEAGAASTDFMAATPALVSTSGNEQATRPLLQLRDGQANSDAEATATRALGGDVDGVAARHNTARDVSAVRQPLRPPGMQPGLGTDPVAAVARELLPAAEASRAAAPSEQLLLIEADASTTAAPLVRQSVLGAAAVLAAAAAARRSLTGVASAARQPVQAPTDASPAHGREHSTDQPGELRTDANTDASTLATSPAIASSLDGGAAAGLRGAHNGGLAARSSGGNTTA